MKCQRCGGKLMADSEYSKWYREEVHKCFSCSRRYNKGEMVSPPKEIENKSSKVTSIFKNI